MKDKDVKREKIPERKAAPTPAEPERRGFLTGAAAVVVGGIVGLVPTAAGVVVFLDPLRRKSKQGAFLPVTTLAEIPPDGIPRQFPVFANVTDAWNFYPDDPVGAVYLRRTAEDAPPEAVSATCPHLGCFVDFDLAAGNYKCPCHQSWFEPDGKRINPDKCPAARDLDTLEVKVENDQVLVQYLNFKSATKEKVVED